MARAGTILAGGASQVRRTADLEYIQADRAAIPTAMVTSPRSRAISGTEARSATGTAPTAYRTNGTAGTSRDSSNEATKAIVPRRNATDTTTRARPSGPARSDATAPRGSSLKTRLMTSSTPTSPARAAELTR